MINEKENKKRLGIRLSNLDIKKKIILAFDFDELVVPIHLTREVVGSFSKKPDIEKLNKLGTCSFDGITYLNSLSDSVSINEYEKIRDSITGKTPWRDGFRELLEELIKSNSIVFISSGMKDIAASKLKEIGINPENIIGSEFKISNEKILGSDLIISNELKGYVIEKLKKYGKVIGIGHSEGDRIMLQKSDVSIGFNSSVLDLADYEVQSPEEIMKIIKDNSII